MALNVVGASLLNTMDNFLFDHFDQEGSLMLEGISKNRVSGCNCRG